MPTQAELFALWLADLTAPSETRIEVTTPRGGTIGTFQIAERHGNSNPGRRDFHGITFEDGSIAAVRVDLAPKG